MSNTPRVWLPGDEHIAPGEYEMPPLVARTPERPPPPGIPARDHVQFWQEFPRPASWPAELEDPPDTANCRCPLIPLDADRDPIGDGWTTLLNRWQARRLSRNRGQAVPESRTPRRVPDWLPWAVGYVLLEVAGLIWLAYGGQS